MAKCSRCGADTELYVNGDPVCLECVKAATDRNPPHQGEGDPQSQEPPSAD